MAGERDSNERERVVSQYASDAFITLSYVENISYRHPSTIDWIYVGRGYHVERNGSGFPGLHLLERLMAVR